jgi:hypothetical protein
MRPPKPTPVEMQLKRQIDGLTTTIICLRRDLENKAGYAGRLEYLLRERTERIDGLTGVIERLREQNRKLDEENEHLVAMVRFEDHGQAKRA